jgi:hypothetical protein
MPLKMPDNLSVDYFVSGTDDHGLKSDQLVAGQTVAVTSADPTTVVLTPDTTLRPAPDGSPSIASGKAASANPPANPLKPIAITSHISNADGSDSGIPDAADTIEIDPSLVKTEGILFGVPA